MWNMTKYNEITPTSLHPHPTFLRVPKLLLDPSVSRRWSFLNHVESHWLSQVLQRPGTQKFLPFEEQFKKLYIFSAVCERYKAKAFDLNVWICCWTFLQKTTIDSTVSRHNPLYEGRFQPIAGACEGKKWKFTWVILHTSNVACEDSRHGISQQFSVFLTHDLRPSAGLWCYWELLVLPESLGSVNIHMYR